jgi:hypothetical protein
VEVLVAILNRSADLFEQVCGVRSDGDAVLVRLRLLVGQIKRDRVVPRRGKFNHVRTELTGIGANVIEGWGVCKALGLLRGWVFRKEGVGGTYKTYERGEGGV